MLAHGHQTELETLFDFGCYNHAAPDGAKRVENSPAFQGWDSWPAIFPSPGGDERTVLPSLAGLFNLMDDCPSHKWLGYFQLFARRAGSQLRQERNLCSHPRHPIPQPRRGGSPCGRPPASHRSRTAFWNKSRANS